jgi:hypothetical protein
MGENHLAGNGVAFGNYCLTEGNGMIPRKLTATQAKTVRNHTKQLTPSAF